MPQAVVRVAKHVESFMVTMSLFERTNIENRLEMIIIKGNSLVVFRTCWERAIYVDVRRQRSIEFGK